MSVIVLFIPNFKIKKMNINCTKQTHFLLKDWSLSQNKNTKRSYKSKKIEFDRYCKNIFTNDENPELIIEAIEFGFLNYTAYRIRKKTRYWKIVIGQY